jgi:flavin reductase (DIM6/NTAB) family NADH-FMN oxidoreductase RutF
MLQYVHPRKVNRLKSPYITDSIIEGAVGLVLVEAGTRSNAMTVSFFSEVAHHPTALWVSISRKAYTHLLIEETSKFSLAVLNQTQKALALHCGTVSGRDQDKCATIDLYSSPGGFLFLHGALASTGCSIRESVALGEHTLFIADILESHLDSRKAHLRQLLLSDL